LNNELIPSLEFIELYNQNKQKEHKTDISSFTDKWTELNIFPQNTSSRMYSPGI
jgi:hypothetical protein